MNLRFDTPCDDILRMLKFEHLLTAEEMVGLVGIQLSKDVDPTKPAGTSGETLLDLRILGPSGKIMMKRMKLTSFGWLVLNANGGPRLGY